MALADRSAQRSQAQTRTVALAHNLPFLVAVALVLVGVAAILPLRLSTSATTTSIGIQRLEQVKAYWQSCSRQLEERVATLAALERIEREARERLGMVPATGGLRIALGVRQQPAGRIPSRFLPPELAQAAAFNPDGSGC